MEEEKTTGPLKVCSLYIQHNVYPLKIIIVTCPNTWNAPERGEGHPERGRGTPKGGRGHTERGRGGTQKGEGGVSISPPFRSLGGAPFSTPWG